MRFSDCVDFTGTSVSSYEGLKSYVSTGALDCDHIDFDKVEEVSFADKPSRANVAVQVGDVLFAKMMATKKTLRINNDNKDFIYSTGFCAVRPKSDVLSSETLYRLLTSDFFLQKKDQKCTGATQKATTNTELGKIEINVPSLDEQNDLEIKFEKLDDLIAKRNSQLEKLETLSSALFYEMFGDQLNGECTLVDQCQTKEDIKCGPFGTQLSKNEYQSEGIAVWGIPQINSKFRLPPTDYVSEQKANHLENYSVVPGDIIMSRKGNVGQCSIFPQDFEKGIIHSDVLRIRLDVKKVNSIFMMYQLHLSEFVKRQITKVSTGAIMQGVNVTKLKNIKVAVPPLPLQQEFADKIDHIENQKELVRNSIKKLELLKNSLMQQYFA